MKKSRGWDLSPGAISSRRVSQPLRGRCWISWRNKQVDGGSWARLKMACEIQFKKKALLQATIQTPIPGARDLQAIWCAGLTHLRKAQRAFWADSTRSLPRDLIIPESTHAKPENNELCIWTTDFASNKLTMERGLLPGSWLLGRAGASTESDAAKRGDGGYIRGIERKQNISVSVLHPWCGKKSRQTRHPQLAETAMTS